MISIEKIKNLIIEIKDEKVILDSDVAVLYNVETKRINEAVKNNPEKFPKGYILEISKNEWNSLKSKFSLSEKETTTPRRWSKISTTSKNLNILLICQKFLLKKVCICSLQYLKVKELFKQL